MLESQRGLFDIPRDVAYFNAAAWSPIPIGAVEVGKAGAARKSPSMGGASWIRRNTVRALAQSGGWLDKRISG